MPKRYGGVFNVIVPGLGRLQWWAAAPSGHWYVSEDQKVYHVWLAKTWTEGWVPSLVLTLAGDIVYRDEARPWPSGARVSGPALQRFYHKGVE